MIEAGARQHEASSSYCACSWDPLGEVGRARAPARGRACSWDPLVPGRRGRGPGRGSVVQRCTVATPARMPGGSLPALQSLACASEAVNPTDAPASGRTASKPA